MVSVGGEGRVRHRAVSVFGSPCLPPPIPALPVGFSGCFLYILFGSPATFCLHSSRLVCVQPSVHTILMVSTMGTSSPAIPGVPRGTGQTPAAPGLHLGAGPCSLAVYKLGQVLLSVDRYLLSGCLTLGPSVNAQGTAGSRTDALKAITCYITWPHYMVSW